MPEKPLVEAVPQVQPACDCAAGDPFCRKNIGKSDHCDELQVIREIEAEEATKRKIRILKRRRA